MLTEEFLATLRDNGFVIEGLDCTGKKKFTERERRFIELGSKRIAGIGTANWEIFKKFLIDNGFAHINEEGNFTTGVIDIADLFVWYEKFTEFLNKRKSVALSYNGRAVSALALARGKGKLNPYAEALDIDGVNLFAPSSALKIGAGAAKIFRYAVCEFTKRNSCNADDEHLKLKYILDVKDFAELNGVDTESESAMKNFRHKLKGSLDKLLFAKVTWTEKIKGKPKTFIGMNYIGSYKLRGNELEIEFVLSMAQYLVSLPLIVYPRSLYRLDDREYNAFALGEAMCIHFSQDNNVIRGTEGKLRVETLLASTSFPSYEELKTNRWGWEQNVKEPFEAALDKLTQCGLLKDWFYCHEGGAELTDKEAAEIAEKGYQYFISLLVKFELNDFEAHSDRVTAIEQKKEAQLEKAKRSRKRKKKDKEE